ncbi:mannitol dehydrogenase family protein [Streptomyces sp. NPDC088812]|uniref:mannitol dehydrogenase family protein n=1 Tax=Streptomyces sp. NPDC088812 TaxID=3365905 RepID=UPI0037F26689
MSPAPGTAVPRLSRSRSRDARQAAPVRILHLGLGGFFRAHQAWYTDRAPDADRWGIAAFSGRRPELAHALAAQDGLYTLVTRDSDRDRHELVSSLSAAHPGGDHAAWLAYWERPALAVVTLTVTEAGYTRAGGVADSLDTGRADVAADIAALRADVRAPGATAAARLLGGLAARRAAGHGPVALVSCDNLPGNGRVLHRVVREFAEATGRPELVAAAGDASYVTTMVDRITPGTTDEDVIALRAAGGGEDAAPVMTEPFSEWVLEGEFPAGRPAWDEVGARIVSDVSPHEERKLWLLNGGHSLLAYTGSALGHDTVAEAVSDARCRDRLTRWWAEASRHLRLPPGDLAAYQQALLTRFANARIRHTLAQIAADGSQKLPVRVLPVLRAERAGGRVPQAAAQVIAAWLLHLRGAGAPVKDVAADTATAAARGPLPDAARRVLNLLDPALAHDEELRAAVTAYAERGHVVNA